MNAAKRIKSAAVVIALTDPVFWVYTVRLLWIVDASKVAAAMPV